MSNVNQTKELVKKAKFATAQIQPGIIESVVVGGDLSKLTPEARVTYYKRVCDSLGLNPLTKPFDYIVLNGKLTLYARKDCTQQLCKINKISTEVVKKEQIGDIYIVTVRARVGDRCSEDDGAVNIQGLSGEKLCNAMMKAVTKAKRRAVLGICGLGLLDATEAESVDDAKVVAVDQAHEGADITVEVSESAVSEPEEEIPETIAWDEEEPVPEAVPEPEPEPTPPITRMITEKQRKRLLAIAGSVGHDQDAVKEYIELVHSIPSTKEIPWKKYESICNHFEGMK